MNYTTLTAIILALSIVIQSTAAIMAFALIRITGRRTAWILIAVALALMAVRRMVPLYHLLTGDLSLPPDMWNEVIGLALSVGMAIGVALIGPLFAESKRAEAAVLQLNAELEQRVEQRTAELETAVYDLENFNYSASHDLRIPLRAINGFSKMLLDDHSEKLDEEGRRLLNVVRDNTRKMAQMIDDMQAFSRTGSAATVRSEVNMDGLVREVVEELKTATTGRALKLEIHNLPPVFADRDMMRKVIVNLLSNAIKFTRPKAIALIEVGAETRHNETIYYVKDNGVGFDMQYAAKLFGVFQRLHGPAEFEGNGIGLAMVKRIITRHGGRVWAEGKVNEGATIYFALPTKETDGWRGDLPEGSERLAGG